LSPLVTALANAALAQGYETLRFHWLVHRLALLLGRPKSRERPCISFTPSFPFRPLFIPQYLTLWGVNAAHRRPTARHVEHFRFS
jgi:hypothetical protein